MSAAHNTRRSCDHEEKPTHVPEEKNYENMLTEPAGETTYSNQEQHIDKPNDNLDITRSHSLSGTQARRLYTDWQFLIVFVVSMKTFNMVMFSAYD